MTRIRLFAATCAMMAFTCCSNSKPENPEPTPPPLPPAPSGEFVYVQNGKIYTPQGEELALWGVNLQPCLSWEYNDRLSKRGVEQTAAALKQVTENNLDELALMKVSVIRCHLTPADFTDDKGNLVETPYLDVLDYLVAEADKRGMYLTFAFVNHMGSGYVRNSMWMSLDREEWIHNAEAVSKTKNYVTQLLNRTNKYTNTKYAAETKIALWELINEPAMYSYTDIRSHPAYNSEFRSWAQTNGRQEDAAGYAAYRQQLLQSYIDGMHDLIRAQGAGQPIIWSHNWHRYRNGNQDIFKAALASKAEAIAFCNYPGQDLVGQDYWNSPKDLTATDFSGWFNQYYNDVNGYGWLTLADYANKAKVVYEFETFFNQSAYLYPVQAQYFRALGVQMATMWTYTMQEYAQYFAGSHFLNLKCTPKKAASFIVAGEIYKNTPRNTHYDQLVNEQLGSNFAISKSRDISIFSTADKFYYSNDLTSWCPLTVSDQVKSIVGIGNSPLIAYSGSGIYFLDEKNGELFVTLMPNHQWLGEPWNSKQTGKVTSLDQTTANTMSIKLKSWKDGKYTLYKLHDANRQKVSVLNGLANLSLVPGNYVIVQGEQ